MTKEEIAKIVIRGIAGKLDMHEHEVTAESKVTEDLGADSLDMVEIVMQVEDDFEIEIYDAELERLSTVQDWIDIAERKLAEKEQKS